MKQILRSFSRFEIAAIGVSICAFIINASYASYPDAFFNLLGGAAINQGKIPYKDFFDHHLPFAWYLSAVLLRISFGSYVIFRYVWAIVQVATLIKVGFWIKKNHRSFYAYYLVFVVLFPLVAVHFWLHLFLADSLAAFFVTIALWILLPQIVDKKSQIRAIYVATAVTFCLIMSSMTFIYLAGMLYALELYLILKYHKKSFMVFATWCFIPYILYALYLVISGSFGDFYFANITYNTDHYISIPNYTKGRLFNPIKFAFTLIYNFWGNYIPSLTSIKDFNLYQPIGITAVFGTFVLLIYLLASSPIVGLLFFGILSFSAPRGNIQKFDEIDYQIGVFIMLGLVSALCATRLLRSMKSNDVLVNDVRRLTQALLAIFVVFTTLFMAKGTYDKWYLRYTQKMPSIQNTSDAARFIDDIIMPGEYYWIGPYEPDSVFFVKNGRIPGKFVAMLPQYSENETMRSEFIQALETHPPKIIVFKKDTGIYLTPAYLFGSFLLEWMEGKYTPIEELADVTVIRNPTTLNLNIHLYILDTERDEILMRLRQKGYIE